MKDLNFTRLAAVYAGCFLGAGYVSGQELRQYFGVFGLMGYVGLMVAMLLILLFGLLIMFLSVKTGIFDAERLTVPWELKSLRVCFSVLEMLMMFAVMAIMNAGVGALAQQLFGLPQSLVSGIFALLVLICALTGLSGIVSVFSLSVPLLVGAAVIIGGVTLARGSVPVMETGAGSGLLGNWFVSAVNFACYNFFVAIIIIAPFGQFVKKRATIVSGIGVGTLLLLLIALGVLLSVACTVGAGESELPMLFVTSRLSPWTAYLYGLLLCFAMFGTSLSCQVSVVNYFAARLPAVKRRKVPITLLVGAAAFGAGLFGFGDLIGVLYPVFGYSSVVFIAAMAVHYCIISRKRAVKNEG